MGGILNLAGSNPEMAAVAQAMQGRKWTREDARLKQIEDIALRKDLQTEKLDVQKQMAADRLQSQRDIQAMIQANRPERQAEMPVAIMGANGKPTYVSRSQAMGQVPYTATTAKQDAQDVAKEEQKTQATLSAQQVLDNGANLLLHPGRSMATGASGVLPTIPGTDARDFEARLNTYKAETFVPMVSALKGMGALSDAEGKKLTESVGALERTMSEKGFEDSLKETNKFLFDKAKAAGLNVQMPSGLDVHSKADEILGIK
jgi:hypothetical protein